MGLADHTTSSHSEGRQDGTPSERRRSGSYEKPNDDVRRTPEGRTRVLKEPQASQLSLRQSTNGRTSRSVRSLATGKAGEEWQGPLNSLNPIAVAVLEFLHSEAGDEIRGILEWAHFSAIDREIVTGSRMRSRRQALCRFAGMIVFQVSSRSRELTCSVFRNSWDTKP
jgi:hypothetical protein